VRFSSLFSSLGLKEMEEWNVDIHLPMYLKGEIGAGDSQVTRYLFLNDYSSAATHVWNWYDALPEAEKERYRRFVLPPVNPLERFHFKLWDRRSFVLDPEHANLYHPSTRECAKCGLQAFSAEQNTLFLELIKTEQVEGAARQAWLRQWGYGQNSSEERMAPFKTDTLGLLSWGDGKSNTGGGDGQFIMNAQRRTTGTLIPVESLSAAATFGLLALDLLTTTGMRCGELMQVNLLPSCIVRLVDDPPPGARDRSPRIRYLLRLLPKGERTETLHNYGVGKESMRLIERTAHLLCEHYALQPGEPLPCVAFDPGHSRSHRFEREKVPYLFQYNHQHLSDSSITACLRFLMHGMVLQTSEGKPVVLKPHLLRHAFATYAVHVEGLPLDLIAKWLQQKNLEVTGYYSEMPEYMQLEQHASFVGRLATQINVREAILRSPEEIQKQAQAARKRVGMLVPVCGGECTLDAYCPNQFECIHCPAKAPDPEKRSQVEEKRSFAEERLAYYEREGLVLEAEKMKQLIRGCDLELQEMHMMVAYREDESHVIQIQPRTKRP
jgi:hypothetical protein